MRQLLFATTALLAMATLAVPAQANPDLSIRVFEDGTLVSSLSRSNAGGSLNASGSTTFFSFVSVTSAGFPLLAQPELTVQNTSIASTDNFTGTHTMTLEVTQTGIDSNSARTGSALAQLANSFTQNFLVGSGVQSVTSSNYIDANNGAFERNILIGSLNSSAVGGPTNASGLIVSPTFTLSNSLFSETVVISATFNAPRATLQASSQIVAVAVPEPASLALFGVGLLGLGMIRQRRNKA